MVTFNVDSLDFVDDEEARFGADADFATRFSSANTRLELEDLTNSAVGYIPQDVSTDLVDGKFAETVDEGKALADDGNVYDSPDTAVSNATSWVKIGPGVFGRLSIGTSGMTVVGSGDRTILRSNSPLQLQATNVTVANLSVEGRSSSFSRGVDIQSSDCTIENITVREAQSEGINTANTTDVKILNCDVLDAGNRMIRVSDADRVVVANCLLKDTFGRSADMLSFQGTGGDCIAIGNIVIDTDRIGLRVDTDDSIAIANFINTTTSGDDVTVGGTDNIIANNRIINGNINDVGTGTVLDANLTT